MQRVLDWIDESAAGLIRLAYLAAGVLAVADYFGSGHIPGGVADALNASLPWVLAGAVEIHTYLTARRVRAAWQQVQATTAGTAEYEQAVRGIKVNLGILAVLLAFSVYNQAEYLAATWQPPSTALTLPAPWAFVVRAVVTPAAFMAAAFLAPMGENLNSQVRAAAHDLLRKTFRVAKLQWQLRLAEMQRDKRDVTAALVQLVEDPTERRMIQVIHNAMYGDGDPTGDYLLPPFSAVLPAPQYTPPSLPTGGGSPAGSPDPGSVAVTDGVPGANVVQLPKRSTRRNSGQRRQAQRRGVRTVESHEAVARSAWAAGNRSVAKMREATGMSQSAAGAWVRTLKAEGQQGAREDVAL